MLGGAVSESPEYERALKRWTKRQINLQQRRHLQKLFDTQSYTANTSWNEGQRKVLIHDADNWNDGRETC